MLLWLAFRCNKDRFNSAYATYLGRFGKTIDGSGTLTEIWLIGLIGEENVFYVSPAHSEIIPYFRKVNDLSENIIFWKGDSGCKRQELLIRYLLGSDIV